MVILWTEEEEDDEEVEHRGFTFVTFRLDIQLTIEPSSFFVSKFILWHQVVDGGLEAFLRGI